MQLPWVRLGPVQGPWPGAPQARWLLHSSRALGTLAANALLNWLPRLITALRTRLSWRGAGMGSGRQVCEQTHVTEGKEPQEYVWPLKTGVVSQ